MLKKFLVLLIAFILCEYTVFSQEETGLLFEIDIKFKSKPLPNSLVKVFRKQSFLDQVKPDSTGKLIYLMPFGSVYQLHFSSEGMVTKILEFDLESNTPDYMKETLFEWSIGEIELFKSYDGIDMSVFNKPVARIHYDKDFGELSIDYEYSKSRKKELTETQAKVDAIVKNEEIEKKENEREAEPYLLRGNKAYKEGKLLLAKSHYERVLDINPQSNVKTKLIAINNALDTEKEYKDLLIQAESNKRAGKLQEASNKYIAAAALKPEASFPKQELALLAKEIEQNEIKSNAFNNFMSIADEAFEKNKYEIALSNYKKALAINPEAILTKLKIKNSKGKLDQQNSKIKEAKAFNDLMVASKNARVKGSLEKAQELLSKASDINPESKEVEAEKKILDNLIAQQEEKRKKSELLALETAQKKYNNYFDLGKKSSTSADYKQALFFYNKASEIKSTDEVKQAIVGVKRSMEDYQMAVVDKSPKTDNTTVGLEKMDKASDEFQSALAKLYPEGKTVNNLKSGNKTITQVIVIKDGRGTEYQKVKYSWGGLFYFRNGTPITIVIWEKETK